MRMKTKQEVVCVKCGAVAPIDQEKSNENWTVYDTSKPCPACGNAEFEISFPTCKFCN